MPHTARRHLDLTAAARSVLRESGFEVDLSGKARSQLDAMTEPLAADDARDLRELPWSSIDNATTRDLDQVEAAESLGDGATRIRVAIADVDSRIPKGSPLDAHAARNTVSVYAGDTVLPMLPERLSTDLTSLVEGADRLALVAEMVVDADGRTSGCAVYRALVRNRAQLDYESVGAWLAGTGPLPAKAAAAGMAEQLRVQGDAARRLRQQREARGALELETIEARPVLKDGRVVDIEVTDKGRARDLIEDFMIAANAAVAGFLEEHDVAWIRRLVPPPERWPRIVELARRLGETLPPEPDRPALAAFLRKRRAADPAGFPHLSVSVVKLLGAGRYVVEHRGEELAGHFGLAVQDYTHSTAPNRRFADLVSQRLVKAVLAGTRVPYTDAELDYAARHCTEMEDRARRVERLLRKLAAMDLVQDRVGDVFDAIVTGASAKGTWVRVRHPAIEGKVVRGERGMDVGDHVRVRLVQLDPERGYIDFVRG
ncbi:MAG TPA: RNB domain-containing ribonuclease [Longimicrobiales bacterium]|nr:RNB domain-containing ribonuclease [Longimicrobiales bacterium]